MNIYAIKNEKLGFVNRPIYCESQNEALSYIQNILMSDADRALLGLKDDLALYCLGRIDFTTGSIQLYQVECFDKIRANAGDIIDFPCFSSVPERICSLKEIFDTIPEDKIKPAITRDDLTRVYEEISKLKECFQTGVTCFEKHSHDKKGDIIV